MNNDEIKLNLLILGKTGTGKSSLLNSLVGKQVEETGIGKPVTKRGIFPHETSIGGKDVVIYDSWGLEVDKSQEWEKIIKNELEQRGVDKDIKDWFHSVTYCIQAGGNRIEDFDKKIIKQFTDKKYNVVIALTKSDQISEEKTIEFINIIKKETNVETVISVSAAPEKTRFMTETPEPFGLSEYQDAILASWKKIFLDRVPISIIERLKKYVMDKGKFELNYKFKDCNTIGDDFQDIVLNEFQKLIEEEANKYLQEYIGKYYNIYVDIMSLNVHLFRTYHPKMAFPFMPFPTVGVLIATTITAPTIADILFKLIAQQVRSLFAKKIKEDTIEEIAKLLYEKLSDKDRENYIRETLNKVLDDIDNITLNNQ